MLIFLVSSFYFLEHSFPLFYNKVVHYKRNLPDLRGPLGGVSQKELHGWEGVESFNMCSGLGLPCTLASDEHFQIFNHFSLNCVLRVSSVINVQLIIVLFHLFELV